MAWQLALIPFLLAQAPPPAEKAAAPVAKAEAAPTDGPAVKADPNPGVAPAAAAAADPAKKAAPAPAAPDNGLGMIVYVGPLILLFYLLIIRPQRQQESKHKKLLNALKKGDKILTSAGIYGTVMSTDPATDKVVVRIDEDKNVKITFSKASIARVIEPQPEKAAESPTTTAS